MAAHKHFIQDMHLKAGGLHQALNVPQGQKIPAAKLQQALHSKDLHIKRMAEMAVRLKAMNG